MLIVLHHLDMVLPFEVTCSAHVFYFILLVLRKAPGGQILNVHEFLLRSILDYITTTCRFNDLQEAVYACLAARRNEVRLVRNVTLPSRLPQCIIPRNETVKLLSSSEGPFRLRTYNDGYRSPAVLQPIFVLGDGARLSIERVVLEFMFRSCVQAEARNVSSAHTYVALNVNAGLVTLSKDVTLGGYQKQVVRDKSTVMRYCPGMVDLAEAEVMGKGTSEIPGFTYSVIGKQNRQLDIVEIKKILEDLPYQILKHCRATRTSWI